MLQGFFVINPSGALVFYRIPDELVNMSGSGSHVDKIIALASTVYAAMEILMNSGACPLRGKYTKMEMVHETVTLTALRTCTRMIFVLVHGAGDSPAHVQAQADRIYEAYVERVMYDPMHEVGQKIPPDAFTDILSISSVGNRST